MLTGGPFSDRCHLRLQIEEGTIAGTIDQAKGILMFNSPGSSGGRANPAAAAAAYDEAAEAALVAQLSADVEVRTRGLKRCGAISFCALRGVGLYS